MQDLVRAKKHLIKADERLASWVKKLKLQPMALPAESPYERLARAIVSQQISVAAARTIWGRFSGLFDNGAVDFERLVKLEAEHLRAVGLSKQKIGYIQDLAQRVVKGDVPAVRELITLPDHEIVDALLPIKGVGEWTVQMLLIFHLQRPDVWPVKDLGMKKGFMKVHNKRKIPEEKFLQKYGERFRPFRSYAALYYWKALE